MISTFSGGSRLVLVGFLCCHLMVSAVIGQETDQDEVREKGIIDRFVVVLEKNPRRGTALDKVYGYHVERGSLEKLIQDYRQKTTAAKPANAGPAWMIVGLLESLRGQDAAAVEAFGKAEEAAPGDSMASYYLGQSLVLIGQPDKAAEALERAIKRKPAQADLLDVFQALGRVYQRAQKTEQALEVWNRLEKQFPNDARVQEQIATTLLEENQFESALPRFQALAKMTKDKYRQSLFEMEAAELKVKLGKASEAINEFEKLLSQLNPDNWLYREVRRRIEAIYLRTDDQSGLVSYYEDWIKRKPEDLEAVSRLARLLAGMGRTPEAQSWLEKGLKLAPKKKELRNALISQLTYEQKYAEAIAQYEQLDRIEPNNPDTLREWGRLILKDTARDEATRKADAAAVWRRLTAAKPKDPLITSQVGELFRQAAMTDEALEFYKRAIELAPDQSQYREYLGEYYHSLDRKDEALKTWREIADGKLKTAPNVARLAEVLSSFGYLAEAVETNAEACRLDPRNFSLQVKQVDLLSQADKHQEAHAQLALVQKLAANDEEREAWIVRDLRELEALDQLKERIVELASQKDSENAEQWYWLARAYESQRQLKEASQAIEKASAISPQSVPVLMASARIQELQNNLLAAVEVNTRLAAIDRRYRTEYLKQVAQLEQKLGRRDKAIQAGRDLIASAPGNPEGYEFFSQLCFQLGETEEGLSALRRSVRVNPSEPRGLLLLAAALGEQFRTGEAIELYWRAFDNAGNLEDRLGVVPKLTELYLQTNQLDRLLERLERLRREPNRQREMTICLAQVYQTAGDDGNARQELEKLLTEDTRDIQLLSQLVKLCESEGDLESAVKFQQQLLKSSPGKDSNMRLAQLLMKWGEKDEANALMSRVIAEEKDPDTVLKSVDAMLKQENYAQALSILQKLTRDQPKNWELLYREGVALAKSKSAENENAAEARSRFKAILALKLKDDELGLAGQSQGKKPQGRGRALVTPSQTLNPLMQRAQHSWQIRQAVGLDNENYYGGQQQPIWIPSDFGTARMASLGWLTALARHEGKEAEFLNEQRQLGEVSEKERELFDWYYLSVVTNNSKPMYLILKKLSMRPDADAGVKSMYLASLNGRGIEPDQEEAPVDPVVEGETPDESQPRYPKLAALSHDEMEHVLSCYRSIDDSTTAMTYGQNFLQQVVMELKRCGRREEANQLEKKAVEEAKEPLQLAMLLPTLIQGNDFENTMILLDRMLALKTETPGNQAGGSSASFNYAQYIQSPDYQSQILAQLMARRAQKKNGISDVLPLWDRYLKTAIRRYEQQQSPAAVAQRSASQRGVQNQQRGYVYVWKGNQQQYENLDFPAANRIYDQATLQMLRQIYVIYKDADALKDLIAQFQQKVATPDMKESEKIFWQFGLAYLHWWTDDKDEALAVLSQATEQLHENPEMKFELARLYEQRQEHDQALAIIDSLSATDQQALQQREITALRMAVNSGNIERARTAAERLFGLRLDSNLQIQLAQQMHQLGMHEQAEAVLSRAGRQAGNKTDVLANLMQQYQSQGKNDLATQIAHQLLRRSPSNASTVLNAVRRRGMGSGDNGTRQQALMVLKRSGKLPEMIKKVENQLKSAPNSQRLTETLIEYYTANGDTKKVEELTAKISETKQDDPAFRYALGQQLLQQGKHKEAVEHFKVALKKDPQLARNNFYQIINTFQNADKMDDLVALLKEFDLKAFRQNPWELTNVISNLSYQDKTRDHAVELFKRAWKELPDQRQQFLSSLNNDIFWQMPEIYDYARQGIIPSETSLQQSNGWHGFGQIQSYSGDGQIKTLINRFLTIATTNKKLDELTEEIVAAQKKVRHWEGGKALLALIDLRRGKVAEGKQTLETVLQTIKAGQQRGNYTLWEIGQELRAHDECTELAIRYFEAACKDPDIMTQNEFQYTPGKPLASLYTKQGRKADARRIILEATKPRPTRHRGNEDYEAYQRINNAISLGQEISTLGFPMDAIRVYQGQLARAEDFTAAVRVYGGGSSGAQQIERLKKQLETGFQTALKGLKPEALPELLSGRKSDQQEEEEPIDLLLIIDSRELDVTRMSSALANLVTTITSSPEMVDKTKTAISELRSKSSDDISQSILVAQISKALNDADNYQTAVTQLVDLVERTPLDPAPEKGTFTAAQRDAAKPQIGLWIVGRDCIKQESLRSAGVKLAERALEAAQRQADRGFELALLREWGQLELERGDPAAAERRWAEMLEVIIPKPPEKPKKPEEPKTSLNGFNPVRPGNHVTVSHATSQCKDLEETILGVPPLHQAATVIPAKIAITAASLPTADRSGFTSRQTSLFQIPSSIDRSTQRAAARRMLSRWEMMLSLAIIGQNSLQIQSVQPVPAPPVKSVIVTLDQFEKATQIAKLAAENGLTELSIKAMSKALQSGPPLNALQAINPNQPFATVSNPQQDDQSQVYAKVSERLTVIEHLWRQKAFPEEAVYSMLKSAVLPERRPLEVFLYLRPLTVDPSQPPQSVGSLLVLSAIRANKVDELKSLIEPKLTQPLGELSARVLLAQIALATRDKGLATEQLEILNQRLQQDTLQNSSELACHVAIPALSQFGSHPTSMELFERAVEHFTQNSQLGRGNAQEEPLRTYRFKLARAHFANQNMEAGKKHLEEYLNSLIPMYARYSGGYGQVRLRAESIKVAAEYARAGLRTELLKCLGQYADTQFNANYGREPAGRSAGIILAGLASLPDAERYQLLLQWSLPTPERNSVRIVADVVQGDHAPGSFDSLRGNAPRGPRSSQVMSTAELLIAAAAKTDKLDELQAVLTPLAEQNIENAAPLLMLVRIANGKSTEAHEALLKLIEERKALASSQTPPSSPLSTTDLLVAHAAIADPHLSDNGRELARQSVAATLRIRDLGQMSLARRESFAPFTGSAAADRMADRPWDQGLKYWTSAANPHAVAGAARPLPALWIIHEDVVSHVCGPGGSELYFKYPLEGEFTVSFDSWVGRFAESAMGYGGVLFNALQLASKAEFTSLGNRTDTVIKPPAPMMQERFNRSRLEVTGKEVRYYANDVLLYSEPRSTSTSPFLFLFGSSEWNSAMTNLKITGNPVIPRQVTLIEKDSLLGWDSDFYGETRPFRHPDHVMEGNNGEPLAKITDPDWSAREGELHGRYLPFSGLGSPGVLQSRIYYDRPLLEGETIDYEFWYEPGVAGINVAPAVDRLAFLFDERGVHLHWMTEGNSIEEGYAGLDASNVLTEENMQRGRVSLKPQDWNSVKLTLNGDLLSIMLNGSVVAERRLESDNSRQFGFYHDKRSSSVRVRNVVLKGDWPETVTSDMLGNLLATTQPRTREERQALSQSIEEKFHFNGLDQRLNHFRSLPEEARYERLADWVLAGDDHRTFRLYGSFTSDSNLTGTNQLAARFTNDSSSSPLTFRRQRPGGDLFAPALDLVDLAKQKNQLNELSKRVTDAPARTPVAVRSKLALQILISIAAEDLGQAAALIPQLHELAQALPEDASVVDRWPELLVSNEATRYAELRGVTLPLLNLLVDQQHKRSLGEAWDARVTGLRDQCRAWMERNQFPPPGAASPKGQWTPVSIEWADAHGRGPVPRWLFHDQGVSHLAGYGHDYLYFQSPLTGSFTVDAEVSTYGWREIRLMYNTQWVGPQYTKTVVDLGNLTGNWSSPKIEPTLEFNEWCRLKLVVEPGRSKYYLNDRVVFEQALPDHPDPWVALMSWGTFSGGAKMVRIKGEPTIPEELKLSSGNKLTGWTAGMYHDPMSANEQNPNTSQLAWVLENGEIQGRKFEMIPDRARQSLLRYHRPLIEDSVVSYDFFYVPGQTLVHPAIGRKSFLLDPDGIKVHWLTDGQWETSALTPTNTTVIPAERRGPANLPFKPNDWNRLQLTLTGDTVSIRLNDVEVYESPVELTNQRQFGLFHYADQTDVRVKNVVYRGEWPRTLPSLQEQELADMGPKPFQFAEGELQTRIDWNFRSPMPSSLKPTGKVTPNAVETRDDGLKIIRGENASAEGIGCGFLWDANLTGDFELTLVYRTFESRTEQQNWQIPRIELFADIGGPFNAPANTHQMMSGIRRAPDGILTSYTGLGNHAGDKYDWTYTHGEYNAPSGRFRLVRKGDKAYYLIAKEDSDEWTLSYTGTIGTGNVTGGNFTLRAEMPTSSGSAVFTRFTLKSSGQSK
ncbi:DUF1583 domain-containing protein [Schlesneria sp. DSM 10557]|uniref:DUF1583 domain-containing protein n=1 Tax=Schlesneria sp. DSM 10557 TaxID=3044399 RepID=UPI0035A14A85